jgi:hypothetical protein
MKDRWQLVLFTLIVAVIVMSPWIDKRLPRQGPALEREDATAAPASIEDIWPEHYGGALWVDSVVTTKKIAADFLDSVSSVMILDSCRVAPTTIIPGRPRAATPKEGAR